MQRLLARFAVLGEVFRSRQLRQLELAWAGHYAGEWAHFVALSVYAYSKGGVTLVGVFGLVRMLPAAAATPFGSMLADRYPRQRVLLAIHLGRATALAGVTAVLAVGGPTALVFTLAGLAALWGSPYRPAHLALLPSLARNPRELVAANVSSSTLEGVAVLSGTTVTGGLLTFTTPDVAVGASAAVFLWAAFLVSRLGAEESWVAARRPAGWTPLGEVLAGFRTLAQEPRPRLIISLFAAQTFVRGLLNVLLVATSLKFLRSGDSGVGFLNAAFGGGGLLGGLAALGLVGRRRLAGPFGAGLVLWGAPIALVAAWPMLGWGLLCLAVVGAGNAVLDVAGFTLVQRTVDDRVLGRVFGVTEILAFAMVGIGSILAPVLIDEFGVRHALIVAGVLLPVLAVIFRSRLAKIDASVTVPEAELTLLASTPIFAPLPVTTLEKLASRLTLVSVPTGTEVVRQGDAGDRFYLIADGEVEVVHDGAHVATLGPGQYFGEIALLEDVPRVATCRALTDLELYALERDVFVSAVTGHAQSTATIAGVMTQRLSELEGLEPPPQPTP